MTTDQREFPDTLARFRQAIADLIEPREIISITGSTGEVPPLVEQVTLINRRDHSAPTAGTVGGSRPPLWVGGFDWHGSIRRALVGPVARWQKARPTETRELLHTAMWGSWAPEAVRDIAEAIPALQAARWDALHLIYPQLFTVDAPCPECGERWAHTGDRVNGVVKIDALGVHDLWAECAACRTVWWGIEIAEVLAVGIVAQAVEDDDDAHDAA